MVYANGGIAVVQPVMIIDVDVLFLLNFGVDLAWLWGTARMAGSPVRPWRLGAAAAIGALLAVAYYFPIGAALRTLPGIAAGTGAILGIAFVPCRMGQFLRLGAVYLVAGGAQAGIALLLATRRTSMGVAGTDDALVAVGVTLFGVGARYLWEVLRDRSQLVRSLHLLEVEVSGRTAVVAALLDTGNSLRDPLTGTPAAIVEVGALESMLPRAVRDAIAAGWPRGVEPIPSDWLPRCRLLPFRSVSSPAGVMLAIRPDRLTLVRSEGRIECRALVAVSPEPLHPDRTYRALLPASFAAAGVVDPQLLRRAHHA